VHGAGEVAGELHRHVVHHLVLHRQRERVGVRVLEVLVEHEHVRQERVADLVLGDQLAVGGYLAEDRLQGAVTEQGLAAAAVGGAG